ncbi:uncharacterized protein LOC135938275 isoform X1 [Cloeon dipterum]|uniref:uncharacterized protein LOC135938275 isoform X1 n=2 Tax=Cloeon dipterum TaxID=197152 RepID=UPI0032209C33
MDLTLEEFVLNSKARIQNESSANFGYFRTGQRAENVCVFVAHYSFAKYKENARLGNERDVANLRTTFETNRQCRFREWPSPRKKDLLHLLSDEKKMLQSFNTNDAPAVFVIFILSHGSRDGLIYTDHKTEGTDYDNFTTTEVIEAVKKNSGLENSLKLIFFAPCRGEITDVIHSENQSNDFRNNQNSCRIINFPDRENFVVIYSTVETTRAVRDEKQGSMIVQNACAAFNSLIKDCPLEVVLNKIQNKVHLAINCAGQSPEVKFVAHKSFTVSKSETMVVARDEISTDARANTLKVVKEDRSQFFSWLSHIHAEPVRSRWAAVISDSRDQNVDRLENVLKHTLDFDTLVLDNTVSNLEWIYKKAFGEQSDVGCILLCLFAKIDVDESNEIVISIGGQRVTAGKIVHHFIGPDNEKWIGRPKLFFFINTTISSDVLAKDETLQMRATNHSGWFVAILPNKDCIEVLLEILQNKELKNGSSLQELAMKLLSDDSSAQKKLPKSQIASTLSHLLDFPDWPMRYIQPKLNVTVRNVPTNGSDVGKPNFWEDFVPEFTSAHRRTLGIKSVEVVKKEINFEDLKADLNGNSDSYSVYVVASPPGSGKSTLVRELAYWANKSAINRSVAKINLLDQIEYFEENEDDVDLLSFLKFALESTWIKNISPHVLKEKQIVIFLDGFDEICPFYRREGLSLIKEIAKSKIPLLITTRPQEEVNLFSALEHVSTTKVEIKPLERNEQVALLKMLLRKSEDECTKILDDFETHGVQDILKNPFHLSLIAENIVPSNINLFAVYGQVVEKKVRQAMVQKESYDEKSKIFNAKVKRRMKLLQNVAVDFLKSLKIRKMSEDEVNEVNNTGLLTILPNKNVRFVHQTFAEFLAAQHYAAEIETGKLEESSFFSHESFKQSRAFIDLRLGVADAALNEGLTAFLRRHLNAPLLSTIVSENLEKMFKIVCPFFTFSPNEKEKILIEDGFAALQAACKTNEEIGLVLLEMCSSIESESKFSTLIEDIAKNNFLRLCKALREKCAESWTSQESRKIIAANLASENGHTEMLKMLVEIGMSVNLKDRSYRNALHYACEEGHVQCVHLLVENGARLEERDADGNTALLLAVKSSHASESIVQFLLEKGADPTSANNKKETALHLATKKGNVAIINLLLKKAPAIVDVKNERDQTALLLASNVGISRILIENGANVQSCDYELHNPLHTASKSGNNEVVRYLLGLGRLNVDAHNINGSSALHLAAKNGHLKICEMLLESGAEIAFKDANYWNALHWAAVHSNLQTIRFFYQRDAALARQKTRQSASVLHLAAVNRHPEVLRFFLESGESFLSDLNEQTVEGLTVLMYATARGHVPVVQFLCRNGADVCLKDENGSTALHWAVKMGNPDAARFLLSVEPKLVLDTKFHGENVYQCLRSDANFAEEWKFLFDASLDNIITSVDKAGWSVLHETASAGSISNLEFLLQLGCFSVDDRTTDERTPLHLAASREDAQACKLLLQNGADATLVNNEGSNALHFACEGGNLDVLELLLSLGTIDLNAKNKDGNTVLHLAAEKSNLQITQYLLGSGQVSVDERDKRGSTAFHLAAKFARVEMCKLLLTGGADLYTESDNEVNALMMACNGKNWEVLDFLLQRGNFDLEKSSFDGRTALHFAAASGDLRCTQILLAAGADINAKDLWNRTPIQLAEFYDSTKVVNFLAENGALIENEESESEGETDETA